MICDAHNHLQDARLPQDAAAELERLQIQHAVVNGTSEKDWAGVLDLSRRHSWIVPSLGLHPWFVRERSPRWKEHLRAALDSQPCGIGEIGLDRWIENPDCAAQEEVFLFQLGIAAERNLPASIHCLKAWGWLHDLLKSSPLPACGFLIHSYNGPQEMLKAFLDLGAYLSISGYFALPKKDRQRATFRAVPLDRILVETDAPDMLLPEPADHYSLKSADGERLNHPGNITEVYRFAAGLLHKPPASFAAQVAENFRRLFGGLLRDPARH